MDHLFQIKMTTTMGRGIFALQDLPSHTRILDLDQRKYITYGKLAEHSFFGLLTDLQEVTDKKAHFAFYMAFVEKYNKRQMIHYAAMVKYIQKLPAYLHSLILWNEGELLALKNQKLVEKVKHKLQDLSQKFTKMQEFLINNKDEIFIPNYQSDSCFSSQEEEYFEESKQEGNNQDSQGVMNSTSESQEPNEDQQGESSESQPEQIQFNEYKGLCAEIKMERFMHFYCAIESRNIYHLTCWDTKSQIGALISVLQLFNHSPKGQIEKKMYHLQSITEIKKGQQIFINYGEYNNDELLFTYGCVIDDIFEQRKNDYVEDWKGNGSWIYGKSVISQKETTKERLSLAERYNKLYEKELLFNKE